MSQSLFSLKQLVPEFSILWEGTWQSSDGFSAIIVAFLLAIGLFFAVWTAYYFIRSFLKVNFFSKLLKGVKPEDLAQEQRNILNKALDKNNEYGKLWREFNETLVLSADKRRLHNTLDAAHFFNTRSLARNLTENRLLSAVPGFLTAIGVIGTFAGLEMGLANLQLNSQAGVDALRDGINSMINGASVAFITSVWGVFCSVVFNFYEKVLERIIRRKITNLQNKIDYLYPRINAEQSLVSIADYSRSSNETLQGLAEKIGTTMQEALVQTTDTIRTGLEDSLNTILQPAIQALVDNTNQSSEKVLNNLVERFIGSVGDAGNTQRDIMKQASSELCEATQSMSLQMQSFINEMRANIEDGNRQNKQKQDVMEDFFKNFSSEGSKKIQELSNHLDAFITNMDGRNKEQIATAEKYDQEKHAQFEKEIRKFDDSQAKLMEEIKNIVAENDSSFSGIFEQMNILRQDFKELSQSHRLAGEEVVKAAQQMNGASNQLGLLSNNLKQASEQLGKDILIILESTKTLSDQNCQIQSNMETVLQGFQNLKERMESVSNKLLDATKHAESGFSSVNQHLDTYQQTISQHVEKIQLQVSKLLNDFSKEVGNQTTQRLNVWNEQTSEFSRSMVEVAQAFSNVIDELEVKLGIKLRRSE